MFDFYVPGDSRLHHLDPRVKLWGLFALVTCSFVLTSLWVQILFLIALHALLLSSGIAWAKLRDIWRPILLPVGLILVLQPFFTIGDHVWLTLGPLLLTSEGVYRAGMLALRALVMAFVAGGLLLSTDQRALVRAFVRLGMPYTWGLTLSLTLRFLPAIQGSFYAVREAQAARGWVPEGNFFKRLKEYFPVLIAVIIAALRTSDQLTLSLAARGLARVPERTVWRDLHMRRADWIAFVCISLCGAAILLWYFGVVTF